MSLPRLVDEITIIDNWIPKVQKHPCFLYDFKTMGVTPKQFGKLISGRKAMLFEKPLMESLRAVKCPWCDFNEKEYKKNFKIAMRNKRKDLRLSYHVMTHNKNFVNVQALKFQQELYTYRLQLVREGYHGAIPFLVEHECNFCINPKIKGRENKCAIPESSRNKMRSLKVLGYPLEEITKERKVDWSILGIIVLRKF